MPQPKTSPKKKVTTISLETQPTADGDECVRRTPPIIHESGANVDIVRLANINAPGSGQNIEVSLRPADGASLFDPVPASRTVLAPGESVDWTLKSVIQGVVSVNFKTNPGNCSGHGQGDIVVHC